MGYWQGDYYFGEPEQQQGEWVGDQFYAAPAQVASTPTYDMNSTDSWDAYNTEIARFNTGGPYPGAATNNPFMALARQLGMSPGAAIQWQQDYVANSGIPNFFGNSDNLGQATRALAASKGLTGPGVDSYANAASGMHSGWTESQQDLNNRYSGWKIAPQIAKGAAFALTPAVLGPALMGTAGLGAANFGGGLAGDVLSGSGIKALRSGLSLGGSVLSGLNNQSRAVGPGTSASSQQAPSLADSVLSQDAPSVSSPTSLSNSVMSVSQPQSVVRRPQIRLSPGFRRGV